MKIRKNSLFTRGLSDINISSLLLLLLLTLSFKGITQEPDNDKVPVNECQEALNYIRQENWMADSLKYYGIDAGFALAVVFPEIARYSAIRDWAETRALEMLYVQYGKDYANFSIGRFQMKPSFIEQIEKDYLKSFSCKKITFNGFKGFSEENNMDSRRVRIERLKDPHWQLRYLVIFCILMDERYPEIKKSGNNEKLKFYSTAYNTGYNKSKGVILKHQGCNDFYTSLKKPDKCYNYAEISIWVVEQIKHIMDNRNH